MLDGVLFTTIGRESGLKKKLKLVSSGTPMVETIWKVDLADFLDDLLYLTIN